MPLYKIKFEDGFETQLEFPHDPSEEEVQQALSAKESQPKTSALGTFAREAALGVPETVAFGVAAPAVAAPAIAATAEPPFTAASPLIGAAAGLLGGTAAAVGTGLGEQKLLQAYAPEFMRERQAGLEQHPVAGFLGSLASGAAGFRLATKPAQWGLRKLAQRLGVGAALGAITPPIVEQRKPTLEDVASGVAFTTLYGESRFGNLLPRARAALRERTTDAQRIREDQRQLETPGQAGERGQAYRGGDIQQAPPGPPAQETPEARQARILLEQERERDLAAERDAIAAAEAKGLQAEVTDALPDPTVPWARSWGQSVALLSPEGKVLFNRRNLSQWLRSNPANRARMLESLVGEEHIHSLVTDEDAKTYWSNLTSGEKKLVETGYLEPGATQESAALSDVQMGHEAIRRALQYLARLPMMEVEEKRTALGRFSAKTIAFLENLIRKIRSALGTKASQVQKDILDRVQNNLQEPKAEALAARFRQPKEAQAELFLPPTEIRPERTTAGAAGALPEIPTKPKATVSPLDIGFGQPFTEPPWRPITPEEAKSPTALSEFLTKDARIGGATIPESWTKRLLVMEDTRDHSVHLVSVYPHGRKGAMVVDPRRVKLKYQNRPIAELLPRYEPMYSLLVESPVQNYHQKFASRQDFYEKFGDEAIQRSRQEFTAEPATMGQAFAEWEIHAPVTEAEATALFDGIEKEVSVFDSPDDFALAVKTLRGDALSGAIKLAAELSRKQPSLSAEEVIEQLGKQIYENHTQSKTLEDFQRRTMAQGSAAPGQEAAPGAPAALPQAGATPTGARELTMRERVPPTVVRPEQVPPGTLPPKVPPPPVPEGTTRGAQSARFRKAREAVADEMNRLQNMVVAQMTRAGAKQDIAATSAGATGLGQTEGANARNAVLLETQDPNKLNAVRAMLAQAQEAQPGDTVAQKFQRIRDHLDNGEAKARALVNTGIPENVREGHYWLDSIAPVRATLDYAEANHSDRELHAAVVQTEAEHNRAITAEQNAGFRITRKPFYFQGLYEGEQFDDNALGILTTPDWLGKKYSKPSTFLNVFQALEHGPYRPVTMNAADAVGHRVRSAWTRINRKLWFEGTKNLPPDPKTRKPISVDAVQSPQGGFQNPPGGEDRRLVYPPGGGKPLSVLKDYATLFNNLTNPSAFEDVPIAQEALAYNAKMKHGWLLIADLFHPARLGEMALSVMGKGLGYRGGHAALEYRPQDLPRAVQQGLVSQKAADWALGNVTVYENGQSRTLRRIDLVPELQKNGLNVGKIHDAMYKHFVDRWPVMGRLNRFIFDEFTRGLMTQTAVNDFLRLNSKAPTADYRGLMRQVIRDTNTYYGSPEFRGFFRNKTIQDIDQMLFLAPSWVTGLIEREVQFAGRLASTPYQFAKTLKQTGSVSAARAAAAVNWGTLGRGMGRGLVAMLALTQMLNLVTRRKPTWQNEEEGHSLDAWIPSFTGKKEGFWFSPLSIFAEITHDLIRLGETKPRVWDAVRQIGENKLGVLGRFGLVLATGRGPTGEYPTTTGGLLKTAAAQVAPLPISLAKIIQAGAHQLAPGVPPPPAGAIERQAYSTAGIKIGPGESAVQQTQAKARRFLQENKLAPEMVHLEATDEPSYAHLRAAIRNGDNRGAERILNKLRETRSDKKIFQAMKLWGKRDFTGSHQHERQFLYSLNDRELEVYTAANQQRQDDLDSFYNWYLTLPPRD